jgi:site-specific recombinase XerD
MGDYIRKTFTFEGKRYTVRGKTEKEAIINIANKIRDLEEGKVVVSGNMMVKDWTEKCIATYKTGQSEITRKKYVSRINYCILRHIGNRPLKSIKPIDCQSVLAYQEGNSQYQINQVYQALRFIFRTAKENKLIPNDPTEGLMKSKNGTKNERRSMTKEEEECFLSVNSNPRFMVFNLMYYCGLRPSEAREVMRTDIVKIKEDNLEYNVLHVRGTKTGNANRNVPIPDELFSLIQANPSLTYIAPNQNGNKHDEKSFQRAFNSLRREMNIQMGCRTYRNQLIPPYPLADDFVPYCLRHTYCTNLCRKKVDIRIAKYLMGHADIRITANIYTHVDNSDVTEAAKLISQGVTQGVTLTAVTIGK